MANFSRLKIYVQPYVAKYLEVHSSIIKVDERSVGNVPEGALYFNRYNVVGKLLISLLEHATKARNSKHGFLTQPVVVAVADQQFENFNTKLHPVCISNSSCDFINQLIKEMMWAQLYFKVNADLKNGKKMIDAINEFYTFFGITEEDLSFEARKKGYYRYSKMLKNCAAIEV